MLLPELNDASLSGFLGSFDRPAVLVFHARWSKPARTMLPVVAELAESYEGLLSFALVDADNAQEAMHRFGILSLPTYLFINRGRVVERFIGLQTKEHLGELLEAGMQKV